ncbi:hypothetical protein V8F20_006460 [Naviculisporaceae sp. PSN 640]
MPRIPSNTSSLVLSANTQLPADVRLGQAVSEFAQRLGSGSSQSFCQLQVQLARSGPLSPADVISLTEQLNREGAKRHPAWRPAAGTRIGGFLRRIQQFAAFGDIFIGGSQNLVASGVWATVRAMLEATICNHVYFDQVSSMLMRLSTSWTITQEFAQHFSGSKELQAYLSEYLIRVVRLCQQILVFSQRTPTMLLASSLLSSFETEFLPLQQELDQWGLLIEKQVTSLTTKTIIDGHAAMAKRNHSLTRFISASKRRQMLAESQQRLLSFLSPRQDVYDSIFRRERKRGNCPWLISNPDYNSWKSQTSSLLHLTGHLGSGKTVGVANFAADLAGQGAGCATFFCKREDPHTQSQNSIIGSILYQLVSNNLKTCTWDNLEDGCRLPVAPITVDSVIKLLPSLLPRDQQYFVLLDGLEECPNIEVKDTMQTLSELQSTFKVSLCITERMGSCALDMIRASFQSIYSITLNNPTRDAELQEYIHSEVRVRNSLRPLRFAPELVTQIIEQLKAGAQGMYLWVYLQLEAIFPSNQRTITTNETVIDILGKLPSNLPEAFDQALERISDRRYGMKIFKLVATAAEPLTGDQLRVSLTIDPGNTSWEFGKIPRDSRQLISCCGGTLLELDEEDGKVRLIHHSVVSHLATFQPGHENPLGLSWLEDAEQTMGSICTTYLSYGVFDTRTATQQKIDAEKVVDRTDKAAKSHSPVLAHLIRHVKGSKRPKMLPKQLNILNVLHQIQFAKEDDILKCFLPYASEHWLEHTRFINSHENRREYSMWTTIIEEKPELVKLPWNGPGHWYIMTDYAMEQSHYCLFQYTLQRAITFSDHIQLRDILTVKHLKGCKIKGPWLDDIIARCVAPGPHLQSEARLLDELIDLGASPAFSLDKFPNPEDGFPGIWRIPAALLQSSGIDRAKFGLPLLQAVFQSAVRQRSPPEGSFSTAWVLNVCDAGWYEALKTFFEPPNMAIFIRAGFSMKTDRLLQRASRSPAKNRLAISRLLIEHGALINQSVLESYSSIARGDILMLQLTFSLEPFQDVAKQALSSTKLFRTENRNLRRVYEALRAGLSNAEIMERLDEEVWSSQHLSEILNWTVCFEDYFALQHLVQAAAGDDHFPSASGWVNLLHRALALYNPQASKSNKTSLRLGFIAMSTRESIIDELILRAKSEGILNIGDQSDLQFTALHYAALWDLSCGFSPVQLLLQAGADPNTPSLLGHTPLEVALSSGLATKDIQTIVSDLLQAGADPNKPCSNGLMPLHLAVSLACADLTHILIEAGANTQSASMVLQLLEPTELETSLEAASLISSTDGWAENEIQEWVKCVQGASTMWDYYYIWLRKHQSGDYLRSEEPLHVPEI